MIDELPRHNFSLRLLHNEHKDVYESIEQYNGEHYNWISEEEKELALKHNNIWALQWYPDSPNGFYAICAYNLDKLLEYARTIKT